ncbi:OmpA family protein [Bacteroidales bacterium]|nr:OmpA family protein [Bacteroidales bacterium]
MYTINARKIILLILLVFSFSYVSSKGTAEDELDKAKLYEENAEYYKAIKIYSKLVKTDESNYNYHIKMAKAYSNTHEPEKALEIYTKLIDENPTLPNYVIQEYVNELNVQGKFEIADFWYQQIKPADAVTDNSDIKRIDLKDSIYVSVNKAAFSTSRAQFCPTFFDDGILFYSTDNVKAKDSKINYYGNAEAVLMYAPISADGSLGRAVTKNPITGYAFYEGPFTLFNNNTEIIYTQFVSDIPNLTKSSNTIQGLKLTHSSFEPKNTLASSVVQMGLNLHGFSICHPTVYESANKMIFVSNIQESIGGGDLFVSYKNDDHWLPPVNVGAHINTKYDELFPHITKDSVLFFSSNRPESYGGLDVFYIDLKDPLAKVTRMGYPVNSDADDFGFILNSNGHTGYFTSMRNNETSSNIYEFRFKKVLVVMSSDMVTDSKMIPDASLSVTSGGAEVATISVNPSTTKQIELNPFSSYTVTLSGTGIKTHTINFYVDPGFTTTMFEDKLKTIQVEQGEGEVIIQDHPELEAPMLSVAPDASENSDLEVYTTAPDLTTTVDNTEVNLNAPLDTVSDAAIVFETPEVETEIDTTETFIAEPIVEVTPVEEPVTEPIAPKVEEVPEPVVETPTIPVASNTVNTREAKGGVQYRLQIAASIHEMSEKELQTRYKGDKSIMHFMEEGWHKYYIGEYESFFAANLDRKKCGVKDAFIAAYVANNKLSILEAMKNQYEVVSENNYDNNKDIVGEHVVHYNINSIDYDFKSDTKINDIIQQLISDSSLKLEIRAHTDKMGSRTYNLGLSAERAINAKRHFEESGIFNSRINIQYFGERKLLKDCPDPVKCNDEIQWMNRRMKFVIYK